MSGRDEVERERGSFDAFVVTSYPDLVRLGFLLLGDRVLAEDLAQTVLTKVYVRWKRIEPASSLAYARTVLVREAQRWRKRRWNAEVPTDPTALPEVSSGDPAEAVQGRDFQRALMSLPIEQRSVLVLRYFAMYSEREIADMLGVPSGTVKSRASRALAALRAAGVDTDDEVEQPT